MTLRMSLRALERLALQHTSWLATGEGSPANLAGHDLSDMDLGYRDWRYADFRFCLLNRTNFTSCNLTGAMFTGAAARNTVFRGCNMSDAEVSAMTLQGADLIGVNKDALIYDASDPPDIETEKLFGQRTTNAATINLSNADFHEIIFLASVEQQHEAHSR